MSNDDTRVGHHDLCFGCGLANLFGLQLDLKAEGNGGLRGRFFVKQDHQGTAGFAHSGVLATALDDAMSLAASRPSGARTETLTLALRGRARLGTYVRVRAQVDRREGARCWAAAELRDEADALLAEANAVLLLASEDG